LLEPGSFNIQRKAVVPMLGHLKVDIEVSDNGMKTVEFGKCKESSKIDMIANGILATIQNRARASYKDK